MVENLKEKFTLIYPSRQNENQFTSFGMKEKQTWYVEVKSQYSLPLAQGPRPKFPEGPPAVPPTYHIRILIDIYRERNKLRCQLSQKVFTFVSLNSASGAYLKLFDCCRMSL